MCDNLSSPRSLEREKNFLIESISGPRETLLVPYGIPYDITVVNIANKEKFDIGVWLNGAKFATPNPPRCPRCGRTSDSTAQYQTILTWNAGRQPATGRVRCFAQVRPIPP